MSERSGRRIRDVGGMQELWPALFRQMKKRFGVEVASALSGAHPVAFSQQEVGLEFAAPLLYEKACLIVESFPIEQALNDYLDSPRRLRLTLRDGD